MRAATSFFYASLIALAGEIVCCAAEVGSAPAIWSRKSATPFPLDESWPNEPWEDVYRPAEFIKIKPSVQLVADGVIAIRWKTSAYAKSWAEVSQDGGVTWIECWQEVDGIRNSYGIDFTAVFANYDMTKPLKYKVRARQIDRIDTWGNHSFHGEDWVAGEFVGGYYPVKNYRDQIAARKAKYTGEEFVEEGELKAVDTLNFDVAMFNDIHHGISYYPNLFKQLGEKTAVVVFGGDICDHSRSRQDFEKHLEAPMAFISKHAKCLVTYLRGNHETMGLHAGCVRDHVALHRICGGEAMYGAYTIGNTRLAFLDTGNDVPTVYDPKVNHELDSEFEPYFAREAAWLEDECASAKWKDARNRVAFAHIPFGYFPASPLSQTLFPVLAKSELSLLCAGHEHQARFYPGNVAFGRDGSRVLPYDLAIGGGPGKKPDAIPEGREVNVSWPTVVIVSVRDGKMSVSCIDIDGENIY